MLPEGPAGIVLQIQNRLAFLLLSPSRFSGLRLASAQRFALSTIICLESTKPSMTPDERERMYQLCALIEKEQDHHRFLKLIEELNDLLDRQERRLEDKPENSV